MLCCLVSYLKWHKYSKGEENNVLSKLTTLRVDAISDNFWHNSVNRTVVLTASLPPCLTLRILINQTEKQHLRNVINH